VTLWVPKRCLRKPDALHESSATGKRWRLVGSAHVRISEWRSPRFRALPTVTGDALILAVGQRIEHACR
jgi:hypothetical protein